MPVATRHWLSALMLLFGGKGLQLTRGVKRWCRLATLSGAMLLRIAADAAPQDRIDRRRVPEIDFAGLMFSDLSAEEKDLLKEYRTHYIRIKRFYTNIAMQAREDRYQLAVPTDGVFPPAPGATVERTAVFDYDFHAREGDSFRLGRTACDIADPTKTGEMQVGIITPEESFLLGRGASSSDFFLMAHGKNTEQYVGILRDHLFWNAPYANWAVELEYLLFYDRDPYRITSIALRDEMGEQIARMSLEASDSNGRIRLFYDFYRNRAWALKEMLEELNSMDEPDQFMVRHQVCFYEGSADGIPLLQACRFEASTRRSEQPADEPTLRREFRNIKIATGASPSMDFDVEQLLKKRPGQVSSSGSPSVFRIACIASGVLLLIIGVSLRRRAKNSG